jgi:seryl-tRNA synthetase
MSTDFQDIKDAFISLDKKLDRLVNTVEHLKDSQDQITQDLSKIKDPDTGLFPRIRSLEQWKDTYSKFMWLLTSATLAVVIKEVWDLLSRV